MNFYEPVALLKGIEGVVQQPPEQVTCYRFWYWTSDKLVR